MFEKNVIRFFIFYLSTCFVMIVDIVFRPTWVRFPFELILIPEQNIEKAVYVLISGIPSYVVEHKEMRKEIENLQIKNAQLQTQIAQAESVQKENQELRSEIEKNASQTVQERPKTIAHIISLGEKSYLDVGRQQDVQTKDLVMYQGVLIGQIETVEQFFSSWKEFNQGSFEVVGENLAGTKGVIQRGNTSLELANISADKKIDVGDYIYTSGSAIENIPKGLFVGQVSEVLVDSGSPFKTAHLKQPVDWSMVSVVVVTR